MQWLYSGVGLQHLHWQRHDIATFGLAGGRQVPWSQGCLNGLPRSGQQRFLPAELRNSLRRRANLGTNMNFEGGPRLTHAINYDLPGSLQSGGLEQFFPG